MAIAVDLLPARPANEQELLAGPGSLLATAVEKRQRGNARTDAAHFGRRSSATWSRIDCRARPKR